MNLALPLPNVTRRARTRPAGFNRYLLNVHFHAPGGDEWSAIGGGDSVPEAIAAAREALPHGPDWDVARWNHLFGE